MAGRRSGKAAAEVPPRPPTASYGGMAEEALLQAVLDLAAYRRVRAVHFPPAYTARGAVITNYRGDGKGWPDLHLTGPGGVLYRELKTDTGRLTPDQAQYMADLRAAGCDADVWRPADLKPGGRIATEIGAIARPCNSAGPQHRGSGR